VLRAADMRNTTNLKQIMAQRRAIAVPGAANALFAKIIEEVGFEVAYLTGAGVANMHLGVPDIGLTTMTEMANTLAAAAETVSVPIIVDADTGFGNALNVIRCAKLFERHGAAAMQLEDQVFPKKCGHFAGKQVIPEAEMNSRAAGRSALMCGRIGDGMSTSGGSEGGWQDPIPAGHGQSGNRPGLIRVARS